MTMGDRDYRDLIKRSIDAIGRELDEKIDSADLSTIHVSEAVQCLRRSYYDRVDPLDVKREGFHDLLSGLLRKLGYGSEYGQYDLDGTKLKGKADMIVDDAVILYRSTSLPPDNPDTQDLLFLNACMWIFDKRDGIIIYITGDKKESSFSLARDKKMFEETARRVRILRNLLEEKKTPVLEPSEQCASCQYYQKCFIKEKMAKSVSISQLVGIGRD